MSETANPTEQIQQLFARLQGLGATRGAPLKSLGLSLAQLAVLLCIYKSPGLHANQLAQQLGVSLPTVSVSLRKLEQDGWVRRRVDEADRRSIHLFLTAKATLLAKRSEAFRIEQTRRFLQGLTADEQKQLVALLSKAVTHLEQDT